VECGPITGIDCGLGQYTALKSLLEWRVDCNGQLPGIIVDRSGCGFDLQLEWSMDHEKWL